MDGLREVQDLTDGWLRAFNQGDISPFLDILHDDVEVFDNASYMPYRVESKADYIAFSRAVVSDLTNISLFLKQPSYRQFGNELVLLNAYYASGARGVKSGGFRNFGRVTATYHRGTEGWRIVNLHWSTIAEHNL